MSTDKAQYEAFGRTGVSTPLTPQFEEAVERIQHFTAKWNGLMGLGWLTTRYAFSPNPHPDDPLIIAETEADWEYLQTKQTYFIPRVCAVDDETLERVVIHENLHGLTAPMETIIPAKDTKLCEYTVECLTRAIMAVHRGSNE